VAATTKSKKKNHNQNGAQVPVDAITQANALGITLNLTKMVNL